MTIDEQDVIASFVEEESGERETRLRKQIEGDVKLVDDLEDEGILNRDGQVVMLHFMDRRAVEFRERLRTW